MQNLATMHSIVPYSTFNYLYTLLGDNLSYEEVKVLVFLLKDKIKIPVQHSTFQ